MIFYICLVIIVYLYGVKNYNYWKKRGVKHAGTIPYFGTNLQQYLQRASYAMMVTKTYKMFPTEKIVGFYRGVMPELVIRDLDIIKRILITDFHHFYPRGLIVQPSKVEPMLQNLFFAEGDTWKLLRQRISTAFSSGKLKAMFPLITDRAEKLQVIADEVICTGGVTDFKELMARYTTDFIGACGFGLNMDTLSGQNTEFRWLGNRIFQRKLRDALAAIAKQIFPKVFKNVNMLAYEIEESMVRLVTQVLKRRNYQPSGTNDFIDLMLEVRQSGDLVGESIERKRPDGTPEVVRIPFDDLLLIAQVFVFFGAGFETSSTTSSYTLHQLAFNPECQEKVRKEIDTVLAKHGNKITYDAIQEMSYLDMAFSEAMRMYPSVGFLIRKCVTPNYTIPEVGVTIDDGVVVMIPVQALHNDEQYFKEPEKFIPERFSNENKKNIPKFAYLPFGEGPRACVGK